MNLLPRDLLLYSREQWAMCRCHLIGWYDTFSFWWLRSSRNNAVLICIFDRARASEKYPAQILRHESMHWLQSRVPMATCAAGNIVSTLRFYACCHESCATSLRCGDQISPVSTCFMTEILKSHARTVPEQFWSILDSLYNLHFATSRDELEQST